MTIIIGYPQPVCRARLVLAHAGPCVSTTCGIPRDATPDDLERAGWVRDSDLLALTVRAEKAERERDDLLARINDAEEAARALRAELERHTAPAEGGPTDEELERVEDRGIGTDEAGFAEYASGRRALYDLGVAHERARQQPEKDHATDEELVDLYRKVYETHGGLTIDVSHGDCRRAGVLAVAARVRQERCLVAQAVAMRAGVTISRTSERVPGTTGMWDVYVTRRPDVPGEHYAYGVPTAGVPATLARLLGEVSRG